MESKVQLSKYNPVHDKKCPNMLLNTELIGV